MLNKSLDSSVRKSIKHPDTPPGGCVRVVLGLLILIFVPICHLQAGDEEFNPSVYQIFDPETGYFIDVEPPPDAQQQTGQNHTATATNTTSTDVPPVASATVVTDQKVDTDQTATSTTRPLFIVAGAIILILVAGFSLRKRKDTK